jgi:ATPase subunit of ABC transporter with duplicated ATPase domains
MNSGRDLPGSGTSHLLRLLRQVDEFRVDTAAVGDPVAHTTVACQGGRVRTGYCNQTYEHPEFVGGTLLEILDAGSPHRTRLDHGGASAVLCRYGLVTSAEQRFESLSGGQQARFRILLLELEGTSLLLDADGRAREADEPDRAVRHVQRAR